MAYGGHVTLYASPVFSDELKLKWFNASFNPLDPIPREHFLILLSGSPLPLTANAELVYGGTDKQDPNASLSREQLIINTVKTFAVYLYERQPKKIFENIPEEHPSHAAVDWFFRSQLFPANWNAEIVFDLSKPVTYIEAQIFAGNLQALLASERPPYAKSYLPHDPPPTAEPYFKVRIKRTEPTWLLELVWVETPAAKPLFVEVAAASWSLQTPFDIYDDGTYGDRIANDGIFSAWIESRPASADSIDVRFAQPGGAEVYGRLSLP
jgi:hypothetical protein